ncbi:T9SS type A sorting domain-containing protein [Flavobacterium sp. RSB2_4_14]|uniref:T9SS type A sorting domain-containing protein n=1 Tax=Flavobacterium sp. RSB2_4_14 TaxID=3447665 RepID=UPI003F40AAE4
MKSYFLLVLLLCIKGFSQAGTVDSSFATNGIVLTNYSPAIFIPDASVIQQDGNVVLMGGYEFVSSGIYRIGMSRHKTDGSIDTNFGTNGFVILNVNNFTFGESITLQPDGRIVVAGYIQTSATSVNLLVIRFNTNGSLDTTFGNSGIVLVNNNMHAKSVKIQSDNKIVVGGYCGNAFAVARLNSDGSIDEDFGFNGLVTTTVVLNSYQAQINALNIQGDGKIVVSGFAYLNPVNLAFCTIRYDINGNIDTGFGINGKVLTNLNSSVSDMISAQAIQQDGKIVVTGAADGAMIIARYETNGSLDTTFGTNGVVSTTFGNSSFSYSLLIQPDNKIVVVGNIPLPTSRFFIARYTDLGELDTTFNNNGYNLLSIGENNNFFNSVLLQQDGKLIATGWTQIGNDAYAVIVRFNSGLLNINEIESKEKVKIYPNPASGVVFFDNSESMYEKVSVYNYLGQEVVKPFDCAQGDNASFDLSNLSKGVYLLKFEGNGVNGVAKVVKE